MIAPCISSEQPGWLALRTALWPAPAAEHHREMAAIVAAPDSQVAYLSLDNGGRARGFVEAGLRRDYVNGAATSPVAFLEGIYVAPECRGRGFARALVRAAEDWALARGCKEFASDAPIDNEDSLATHNALGFRETERVVYFIKALR